MDLAFEDGGELGVAEGVFADLADEGGDGNEGLAGLSAAVECGKDDANGKAQLFADQLDRGLQIRVVGNDDGLFVVLLETVEQQVGRDVDVGALFLGLDDLHKGGGTLDGGRDGHHDGVA